MKRCFGVIALAVLMGLPLMAQDVSKEVIWKAAHVVPSENQLAWQEREFIAFIHYTVNAFTDREWGEGTEKESVFNPTELDVRQWVKTCKDAGMKTIILTAKHHDGFCLWPSKFTEHSVKNSPWKNGKGDVVKDLSEACRKAGLKFGVYLSPWDRNQPTYGDQEKYNAYYKNQLRELLTNYGEISEVWLDGAKGEGAKDMEYDFKGYYDIIHELQPTAVIFNGPDIRWVGNEDGLARDMEWSVVKSKVGSLFELANPQSKDLGSRAVIGDGQGLIWYPAETDVSIRPGWFYHDKENDKVKSLEELMHIYYCSVGKNSVLLLNLPPDRRGLIHENDVQRLKEFRQVLDATFKQNLAEKAKVTASAVRGDNKDFGPEKIMDGKKDTYWTTNDWTDTATLEFDLGQPQKFNRIMLKEFIKVGQRVEEFAIDSWDGKEWKELTKATTIGAKRILLVPDTETAKVRVRILQSRVSPTLADFGLFYQPPLEKFTSKK